ncbi:MAG: hypothetical protein NTW48_08870 [Chloroflexi bacterium]|nr:hypothetical protein [Chloroflexota bacterium]
MTSILAAQLVMLVSCIGPAQAPTAGPESVPTPTPAPSTELEWRKTFSAKASDAVLTPDGRYLYVTCTGTNNVVVVDTASEEVTQVIELCSNGFRGEWPLRLDMTLGGEKIYTANALTKNISIINTATNQVVGTVEMHYAVHGVIVRPDGHFAYATFFDARPGVIEVIDVDTDHIVNKIDLPGGSVIYDMVFSHDSSLLFLACQRPTEFGVYLVETSTNAVRDYIPIGNLPGESCPGRMDVAGDDTKLYVPSGWNVGGYAQPDVGINKVFVIDLKARAVISEISVAGGPSWIRVLPDGRLAYLSTTSAQKIFTIDVSSNTVAGELSLDVLGLGSMPGLKTDLRNIVFHPNGKRAYIVAWDADAILVADINANRIVKAIQLAIGDVWGRLITMSPDGKLVYAIREPWADPPWDEAQKLRIFMIDTQTNSVVTGIAFDHRVLYCHVGLDGFLYVVGGSKVTVIDTFTSRVIRDISIPSQGDLSCIGLIPNQPKAYVTGLLLSEVAVIDPKSGAILKRIDIGLGGARIVTTPDGSVAYVSRCNNPVDKGGLVIIDTASDKVIGRIDTQPEEYGAGYLAPLAITPDGKHLWWQFSQPKFKIIEVASNKVVKTIDLVQVFGYPVWEMGIAPQLAFNSSGSVAYLACGDNYILMSVDTSSLKMMSYRSNIGCDPMGIVITPDDKFAYIINRESVDVSVVELQSLAVMTRVPLQSSKD